MPDLQIVPSTPAAFTEMLHSPDEEVLVWLDARNRSAAETAAVLYSQEALQKAQDVLKLTTTSRDLDPFLGRSAGDVLRPELQRPFKDKTAAWAWPILAEASVKKIVDDLALVFLDSAAERRDEEHFLSLGKHIGWSSRPALDYVRVIHLALKVGALRFARDLAAQGVKSFPDDTELQKASRVLAPPRVKRSNLPQNSSVKADREWLTKHAKNHKGKWVALRCGELVSIANSFTDLVAQVGDTKGLLLTKA